MNIFGMMAEKKMQTTGFSDLLDEGMSEHSADESDLSDLDLVIRRRRATKRDCSQIICMFHP